MKPHILRSRTLIALAGAAGLFAAAGASAQTITADPQAIAQFLTTSGYQAEVSKGSDGDPVIRSAASGAKFVVVFYGCSNGRACTSIQFYAGFKSEGSVAVGRMNEWNRTKRFARAYLDSDSDPIIEMDVNLDAGGMSKALFKDNFEVWTALLGEYRTFIK